MSKVITSKRLNELATELLNASTAVNQFGHSIHYPIDYCGMQHSLHAAYDSIRAAEYILMMYEEEMPEIKDFTANEE